MADADVGAAAFPCSAWGGGGVGAAAAAYQGDIDPYMYLRIEGGILGLSLRG